MNAFNEAVVQIWLDRIQRGKPLPMPVLARGANGKLVPVDQDSQCRLEALRRCGIKEELVQAYVVAVEPGSEEFNRLRAVLNRGNLQ